MEIESRRAIVLDIPRWENGFFYVIKASKDIYYLNVRDVEEGARRGSMGFFENTGARKYFFLETPCLGKIKKDGKCYSFRDIVVR